MKRGVMVLLMVVVGCASQAPAPPPKPAAPVVDDQRRIQVLGDALQMCMDGVKQLIVLCPKVRRDLPFDQGIKECLREAEANKSSANK